MARSEIHFVVEEAPEGGYIARAVNEGIFTEAEDIPSLYAQVRDAVRCHFENGTSSGVICLRFTREEIIFV